MAEAARDLPRCTAKEYLEFENDGALKHEFVNGIVYAMSGASRRHNLIAGEFLTDGLALYDYSLKAQIAAWKCANTGLEKAPQDY